MIKVWPYWQKCVLVSFLLVSTAHAAGYTIYRRPKIPLVTVSIATKNAAAAPLPGVIIDINGKRAGASDELGHFGIELPLGKYRIDALIPGAYRGRTSLVLERPGLVRTSVEVLLDQSDLFLEWYPERFGSVLREIQEEAHIRLMDYQGRVIRVERVTELSLQDPESGKVYDLRDYFALEKGEFKLLPSARAALRRVFAEIPVEARMTFSGFVYNYEKRQVMAERNFFIGRHQMSLVLFPDGQKSRKVSGARLRLHFWPERFTEFQPITFTATTDAKGQAWVSSMPRGFYQIEEEDSAGNDLWSRSWQVFLGSSTAFELRPERFAEIWSNQAPVVAKPMTQALGSALPRITPVKRFSDRRENERNELIRAQ